ncbi:SPOR domain-containing protein [Massilia sp. BJB1822]|uniref:SPOR domain-containing protein n=1 Tax=Massilia sp. BJB1822 TaxID=2744470 RepID=UPI001593D458|nr:SPOR domain-containing protein [Massilia sp. BJB1822]NVD98496.1 SPOR domain-containing protein [Massilia sp. BJB1822]
MGLFSKFGKNKQESTGEDSGYYRAADDQSVLEKTARSKRASHAGGATRGSRARAGRDAADPVLPEKKRARRRLVGAIALALAVVIGLPMVLDSEPRPVANDIALQIPSKDKPLEQGAPAPAASAPESRVAPGAALDQSEEIVNEPPRAAAPAAKPAVTPVAPSAAPAAAQVAPSAKPAATPTATAAHTVSEVKLAEPVKPPKAEAKEAPKAADTKTAKAEHKPEAKESKDKHDKPEAKPEPKHAEAKPEPKDVKPAHSEDARALAILEGKPAAAESASKYVIQVAALAAQDKVDELQGKLSAAGIKSYSQKVNTANGERTRVRVGPFASKEEAEKVRAKLSKMGLNGSLVPV